MQEKLNKNKLNRRRFLPFLGGGFLLPFFGFSKPKDDSVEEEYHTVLTKDGRAVKVKASVVESSKVVDKGMSNKSLLGWLKKDENLPKS